jgi:L,D-peptidoglycan transpeptidase YkuD (ErfK/YbiS/YcfS/YnhG family)
MRGRVEGRGGAPHEAWLTAGGQRYAAVIGARGVVRHKAEGDSGTPAGILPLRRVLYRADRLAPPRCAVPREPMAPQDGWCDAPDDPAYNRAVRLPYGARCEALWREDALYDVVGVLGHNDDPVVRGAGSAIFLHLAPKGGAATEGCVGLALPDLLRLLEMGLRELEVI